jgi:hypothetical protein
MSTPNTFTSSLNRFDRFSFRYLIGLSPLIFGFMIWAVYTNFKETTGNGIFWDIFGWLFIAWTLDLIYLVTKMVLSPTVREVIMTKLAGMKERDERESVVAGSAAKFSFLSTLALLLFLFVFSVSNLSVTKHPTTENILGEKKHGKVEIGFNLKALDDEALIHEHKGEIESYSYKSFPLSKPLIILLLIFWQVGSYHLVARRELAE